LFDEFDVEDFTLFVESEFEPPAGLRIRWRWWWPFSPISLRTGLEKYSHCGPDATGG
jgi:hypothetical protein